MPDIRSLKNRLDSVKRTGQVAGAMKNAATAKYAKLSQILEEYSKYSEAIGKVIERFGTSDALGCCGERNGKPDLILLITGNRGLCGGFNSVLQNYFGERYKQLTEGRTIAPLVAVCGHSGVVYCKAKKLPIAEAGIFETGDIPEPELAGSISSYLCGLYESGQVGNIYVIYQKYRNILRQTPVCELYLGNANKSNNTDTHDNYGVQYYPDRQTIGKNLVLKCLEERMYGILLGSATGVLAATLSAMRTAYDNAQSSEAVLTAQINRRRQSEITSGVIETAQING